MKPHRRKNFVSTKMTKKDYLFRKDNKFPNGSAEHSSDLVKIYLSTVTTLIKENQRYPLEAKTQKREGVVRVSFSIHREGTISKLQILSTNFYEGFNREALESVRRAEPFPPFKEGMKWDIIDLELDIEFKLN